MLGVVSARRGRLAPAPLLERNLEWVTSERRSSRQGLYGPRLAGVGAGRVLADLGERVWQAPMRRPGRGAAGDAPRPGRLPTR